jgi:hypothetical protein
MIEGNESMRKRYGIKKQEIKEYWPLLRELST